MKRLHKALIVAPVIFLLLWMATAGPVKTGPKLPPAGPHCIPFVTCK